MFGISFQNHLLTLLSRHLISRFQIDSMAITHALNVDTLMKHNVHTHVIMIYIQLKFHEVALIRYLVLANSVCWLILLKGDNSCTTEMRLMKVDEHQRVIVEYISFSSIKFCSVVSQIRLQTEGRTYMDKPIFLRLRQRIKTKLPFQFKCGQVYCIALIVYSINMLLRNTIFQQVQKETICLTLSDTSATNYQ